MGLLSFVAAVVIVINKIRHPELPVPGWPSVMTAVFFTAGVTNITLGFIGIYTGRLFEQTKNRPLYIIAQATSPAQSRVLTSPLPTEVHPVGVTTGAGVS